MESPDPWKSIPKLPMHTGIIMDGITSRIIANRFGTCAATLDGKVIVMGGIDDDGDAPLSSCDV